MKIKPLEDFKLLGTNIKLDKNTVYDVEYATNIPNYKKYGMVFCCGVLLDKSEYTIVEPEEKKKKKSLA